MSVLEAEAAWLASPAGGLPDIVAPGPLASVEVGVSRDSQQGRHLALVPGRMASRSLSKQGDTLRTTEIVAWVLWPAPGGQAAGEADQAGLADVAERLIHRVASPAHRARWATVREPEVAWPDATGLVTWRDTPGAIGAGYALGVRWEVGEMIPAGASWS